jgi:GT2 family glycosyltransferase
MKYSNGVDIIVADNASQDDSISFIQNKDGLILLQNSKNYGFAGGYNQALSSLKGQYDLYLLLNSDIEVTENWIEPLIKEMKDSKVAACQPKIKDVNKKDRFEHAGAAGGYIDQNYFPFCRGRILSAIEKDSGQYDSIQTITWTSGAAMLIKADLFHKVDGFDADFFAHMEEIDLCLRLGHMGYNFKVVPESVVYHLGGGTLPYNSPQKVYLNFRNSLFMITKNHKGLLLPMLYKRMCIDGIAAFKFLFEGKIVFFWKVFLAHVALYQNFGSLYRKRRTLMKDTQPIVFYKGNIISSYFLEKRKTFSKLNKRLIKS